MTEELTITTERVDDTPLLMAHEERMGIPRLLNKSFDVHGNWQGLSLGWATAVWLSHILSEADHRMNHVQSWAERRQETLSACTRQPVRALDFSDDRLSIILRNLSDDKRWAGFESRLNQNLLRVYALKPGRMRIDTTTCSGYWQVSSDGLFQFGHSKDRRPDLPQVKVMLSALDPVGMPVATEVVSGNRADDPLYIPAIERVRGGLGLKGLLSIALRILTLLEFLVRRALAQESAELAGLYAGNPKRATARSTAERILEAFEHLTLTVIREPPRTLHHITPLSALQRRILDLLDFSPDIYTELRVESLKPVQK